jgi:hypothetical protein
MDVVDHDDSLFLSLAFFLFLVSPWHLYLFLVYLTMLSISQIM